MRTQWALVLVGALATLATVLLRDDLLGRWAASRGGMDAVERSGIAIPAFVPVAVVSFIVYASLGWVLAALFREGHRWARWSLLALAASLLFAAYVVYLADPPAAFAALGVVAVLLDLALCWFLLQPDSGEWVRGAALADRVEHAG